MKRVLLALSVALTLVALAGCGLAERAVERVAEEAVGKAVESATGVSVDSDEGTVTIKGQDGEEVTFSGTEGELAEDFPLPLYPGGKVGSSGKISSNGQTSYTAEILFSDDITKVAEFYEKAMKDRGIAEVSRMESDADGELSVILMGESEKESGWITITYSKAEKTGSVALIYGSK